MILLRHGQSEFNAHFTVHRVDPGIADPKLTALGHAQAERAAGALADSGIGRILASPYTRALQTAAPIARRLGLPVTVHAAVRERYAFSCDVGRCRTELAAEFPELDFSVIEEVWWPEVEEEREAVVARAGRFRSEMLGLPDWRGTLVVCHWGFVMSLTGLSIGNGEWVRFDPSAAAPVEIGWRHH